MCIHKYRTFARFGLMHMIATNLCLWLRVIVHETMNDISRNTLAQHQHNVTSRSHEGHSKAQGHTAASHVSPDTHHTPEHVNASGQ